MKKSYWFMLVIAGMMAIISVACWFADAYIPCDGNWIFLKLTVFGMQGAGPALATVFLACAAGNWIGSRWNVQSEIVDTAPTLLFMGTTLTFAVGLGMAIIGGVTASDITSPLFTIGLFWLPGVGVVMLVLAFAIRGMAHEPEELSARKEMR